MNICETLTTNKTTIFIDPVLGDGGSLYPCQEELSKEMYRLVRKAHVLTPNPTEAALLLGEKPSEYGVQKDGTISVALAEDLVKDLASAYSRTLPIKSVSEDDNIGVCVRFTPDNTDHLQKPVTETILARRSGNVSVGGTGDLFASLLIGKWLIQSLSV